jgi:hypothetical protein
MKCRFSCSVGLTMVALTLACGVNAGEMVGTPSPGKWRAGLFAPANAACMQAWTCTPGVPVLHGPDTVVVTTNSDKTWGVCNAAGGPTDSCNSCSASVPSQPCQYWLEKK